MFFGGGGGGGNLQKYIKSIRTVDKSYKGSHDE